MRLRLDRFEMQNRSAHNRSLVAFVCGGFGLVFFGFIAFVGVLMLFMPDSEGGGIWARRSGIVLTVFFGLVPLALCTLTLVWGLRLRTRFRRLGELAAVSRSTALLATPQIAHALRLSIADADRLVVEATSLGLLDLAPPPPPPTPGHGTHPALALTEHAGAHGVRGSGPPAHAMTAPPLTPAHGPGTPPASGPISSGIVLGGVYRVEEPLGRGGMGEVHAARHLRTGRRYAVKTILAGANASEDALRRFEREATAASALGHPGIVQVHDFNVAPGGLFYLVMDLLEGETLGARLERQGALAWPDAQRFAVELCSALGAAHEHGLLHRDIKPSNVFLARSARADERVVLVDFGLVKPIAESSGRVTSTGAVLGTPMYMSPEQARGEPLDVRSDVYAVAAVVFEMITGAPPFLDRTMASVYARLLGEPPPRASIVAKRAVPRAVDDVLVRALAKDRAARFPSVRALGEALAAITDDAHDARAARETPEDGGPGATAPSTQRMTN